jgi:hypothetical protein
MAENSDVEEAEEAPDREGNEAGNAGVNEAGQRGATGVSNKGAGNNKVRPSGTQGPAGEAGAGWLSFGDLRNWLDILWKEYPRLVLSAGAIILGILAGLDGFGPWWFGFWPGAWLLIAMAIALIVVWLMVVCGYLAGLEKNERKFPPSNTIVMIALPFLVLGIVLGYVAFHWRNTEKIVVLVEPFEGVGEDSQRIAKAVKSRIERSIHLSDRHRVKVVLGNRYDKGSGKDIPLHERALKYRADLVISGWHTEAKSDTPQGESTVLIATDFYAVRARQNLPAIFRRRQESYPLTLLFSKQEIEDFTVDATLAKRLGYEFVLMIGAGAYAAGDWNTAEHYFRDALERIDRGVAEASGGHNVTVQSSSAGAPGIMVKSLDSKEKNVYSEEDMAGDRALLTLYLAKCLSNQNRLDSAIAYFHEAVSLARETSPSDSRYAYIVSNALLSRGIAYRRKNAFDFAASDFAEAGKYAWLTEGIQRRGLDEPRFYSEQAMKAMAEKYVNRGETYLKNREHGHARVELKTAVDMYRNLYEMASDPNEQAIYGIGLVQALVSLGHVHNRIALPEQRDDEHTEKAIQYLKKANEISVELDNKGIVDRNSVLELRADCLRYLGEAHRAQDRIDVVKDANDYHERAKRIWCELKAKYKTAEEQPRITSEIAEKQARIESKIAEEQTRIGDVYRRLNDLEPGKEWPTRAISAYKDAVHRYMDVNNIEDFLSDSDRHESNLQEAIRSITAHHIAHSLLTLADAHISKPDPSEKDRELSCELLELASKYYTEAHKKLDIEKDRKWVAKIRNEEMNFSLTDDLAWCLTLYGCALTLRAGTEPNDDARKSYEKADNTLKLARRYHNQLRDRDYSNFVLNLFALSLAEHKLAKKGGESEAVETFRDACLELRYLTREMKKVWYPGHVCTILRELGKDKEFLDAAKGVEKQHAKGEAAEKKDTEKEDADKEEEKEKDDFERLGDWLTSKRVQVGRQALDRIIESANDTIARQR